MSFLDEAQVEVAAVGFFQELSYPPDLQDEATKTLLAQAELLCANLT